MPQPRSASIGSGPPRVEREAARPRKYRAGVPTFRRDPDAATLRRDRRRGLVLAIVAFVGLALSRRFDRSPEPAAPSAA